MAKGAPSTASQKHWEARAAEYWRLHRAAKSDEVRQVLDHLARVCDEMALASTDATPLPAEQRWVHPNEIVREATAQRWRIREAEYRAIAANAATEDGQRSWNVIAGRCAELADYLEKA